MADQTLAPSRFISVGGIRQHDAARITGSQRCLDLLHRQCRLGLEYDHINRFGDYTLNLSRQVIQSRYNLDFILKTVA
ncbi:hypothetical protein GCM10027428_00470 [Haliea atlantica]